MSRAFSCPDCGDAGFVKDVRPTRRFEQTQIRRRYECEACQRRWTTLEKQEDTLPRGEPSPIGQLSPEEKLKLDKLVANRIQQLAYRLRRGRVE